ncbi:asialoglycoprotein receptor-like 1 [Kryptolebias marmoratus]|uniref:Asialoglycoprotein receptor-like 1 n=1 Tax=Kryptolebias marmoratus TaxID=37003 RepID=A0A3Q3FRD1_KRYMA|nr:asialoglycoprotein receptor-like 1 [Kryptolebias marmoratus]
MMESQYHHFEESDSGPVHGERNVITQTGFKGIVVYILYSILVLLLLVLLLVTGIKFSQLNKEITDVKLHLKSMNDGGSASNSVASKAEGLTALKDVFLEELVPVRGTCREGWASFQRSCYLLSTTVTTWSKAEELCKSHGGHLLVPNNVEELDFISRIAEITHSYWIGLVERQQEDHWSWVDGTDFNSTPKFWDEGQPDNWELRENGEDCGQIHGYSKRKRKLWNDADCSLRYRYICETKA